MALVPRMISNKFYLDDVLDDFIFSTIKDNHFGKMKCDIYEKDNVYYLEMDIPGFDKSDINIEINDNNYLTISAEKKIENNEEDKNYIRKERSYGKYQRSFYIGGIDKEQIEASFINGILRVIMPKKGEEESSKQIIEVK